MINLPAHLTPSKLSTVPVAFGASSRRSQNWGVLGLGAAAAGALVRSVAKTLSGNRSKPESPRYPAGETAAYETVRRQESGDRLVKSYDPLLFDLITAEAAGGSLTSPQVKKLADREGVPVDQMMTIARGFGYIDDNPAKNG